MQQTSHPMMPRSSHDEAARFAYVIGLKSWLMRDIEAPLRKLVDERIAPQLASTGTDAAAAYRAVEGSLRAVGGYRNWQSLAVAAQEQMWRTVGDCVDRQLGELERAARDSQGTGSVRADPALQVPRYLSAVDIHRMPGGYHADRGGEDLRQGAVFDKAASIYHMGRNGGELNDVRGHTVAQHCFDRFPDLRPQRILDLGCTVGHSTVAISSYFPEAEMHGVDVGAALLRYARARAAALGRPIHFSQQNAERTDFADESFDLVVSSAVLHETSYKALPRIMQECRRLLRPGGAVIHLEVPMRFETASTWNRIRGYFEAHYNNEPFWIGAQSVDVRAALEAAGLRDVEVGYQPAARQAQRGAAPAFTSKAGPVHAFWYMASARK
jgi:ubiquinone/menaquinone biosynthesis C-methylase UbiE